MGSGTNRYFSEALPVLAGMSSWAQERLGQLMFPSTLRDTDTVTAARTALASKTWPADLRNAVAQQTAVLAEVITSRQYSAPPSHLDP